jgi:CheY-like chemotaxis protein
MTGRRILLVEDDRFLRRACETSLRQRGFSVAVDGEDALDKVREVPPDLILLDLLMPRMTGIEVLRTLRAQEPTRGIPVLILSNSSREQDAEEIRTLGISDYLVKANLSLQELGDRVTRLLGG